MEVVVVGAGIAGLSAAHHLARAGAHVVVLDAADRVGGRMTTDIVEGAYVDRGAQFLSSHYREIRYLAGAAGLANKMVRVRAPSGVVRRAKVHTVVTGRPWTAVTRGLFGFREVLPLLRAGLRHGVENRRLSLSDYADWAPFDDRLASVAVTEELGRVAAEYLVEPMLAGFYFQEPEQTSHALSSWLLQHGMGSPQILALAGGLGSLPEALAAPREVRLCQQVSSIRVSGAGVAVVSNGAEAYFDAAVLAVPAPKARTLYKAAFPPEDELLATRYSSTVNLTLRLGRGQLGELSGLYGLLVPRSERGAIAAVAVEDRKYPAQDAHFLNVMLAGASGKRLLDAPEDDLLSEVLPELARYVKGDAELLRCYRWRDAEPLSPVGRARAIATYRTGLPPTARVILAGDYMSAPTTEGAAQSGRWAANRMLSVASAVRS
ncbi:MAG TPA: NAD(P)/FAD-dependent oxidoreductase [Acidimicrobiales bacterium]|nr:NAD(P)/FAD-dependent oxidoreductase [Acidimicrobiales bacterium]